MATTEQSRGKEVALLEVGARAEAGVSGAPLVGVETPETKVRVWDVPPTVAYGALFKIKAGVISSAEFDLSGKEIEVYNDKGEKAAISILGNVPWNTTAGQYCAEIELEAPAIEGRFMWELKISNSDPAFPLEDASCTFSFGVGGKAEHKVTVLVVDCETKAPIDGIRVAVRPTIYRGYDYPCQLNNAGKWTVCVPTGEYQVCASGNGYKSFATIEEIKSEKDITVELLPGSDLEDIWGACRLD